MPKQQSEALQVALSAFAPKLKHLLKINKLSEAGLARHLNRHGPTVATKTVNNIANARFAAEIGNLAVIADHFHVPLWVMLIPDLPLDMVDGEPLKRLNKMIRDYIACDPENRKHAENIAAAYVKQNVK